MSGKPLVQCLCATYGRFERLRECVAYFLAQDWPRKQLLILNNHPVPIRCDLDGVTVFNEARPEPGIPRNRLLAKARAEYVHTWDDDDRWLPWHLSQAIEQIQAAKTSAWKPARSWMLHTRDLLYTLGGNNYEASMIVNYDYLRRVGYAEASGNEHRPLLDALRAEKQLTATEMGWRSSYIYSWRGDFSHASAALARDMKLGTHQKTLADRDAAWRKMHQDTGDGKPLTPADVRPMYRELADHCEPGLDEAEAWSLRAALIPYIERI